MRGPKAVAAGIFVVGVIVATSFARALAAEEETRIALSIEDAAKRTVERARVEFLRDDGTIAATYQLVGSRWIPELAPPEASGWGRKVARARVSAFACSRAMPLVVAKETRGSLLGGFAAHPVPRTHVYELQGELHCPAPSESTETGIELAQLLREIRTGEPFDGAAAKELIRIGPRANEGLPDVVAVLDQSQALALRVDLIRALGAIGPGAAGAVGRLGRLLDDPDPRVHRIAATALESIGPEAPGVVEALAQAARRVSDRQTQDHILRILGRMGVTARAAEPTLVAILEDESEEEPVRRAAFSALGHLKTETARAAQERYAATHPILF